MLHTSLMSFLNEKQRSTFANFLHLFFYQCPLLTYSVVGVGEFCCFLALNSSLRLAFLLSVEGLGFFLVLGALLLVVSKEKEKVGPTEREKLKTWPWLASAWLKSMHFDARVELTSTTAAILALLLN